MARHQKLKDDVTEYLTKHCEDAEDRAEAVHQALDAYLKLANGLADTPGEPESIALVTNASVDNTIRAGKFKRGTSSTMDPYPKAKP